MKVAKEFKWEMGHRLQFHQGRCRNLHGHSYRAIVELEGELNQNGMVIDFYDLIKIVNPLIEELDHSFLCDRADSELIETLKKLNSKTVIIDSPTTAENIAKYLTEKIIEANLPKKISCVSVKLFETSDSFAEYSKNI